MMIHPQTLKDGSVIFMEAGIREKIQYGDPTLGWEGDPRLELYAGPDDRLYLWRLEDDGEYRLVARSNPKTMLDERLIKELVAHDVRRGYNPAKSVMDHNIKLQAKYDAEGDERLRETTEKLYHAANRDIGHLY